MTEFFTGHDLNDDGKNDLYVRHKLPPMYVSYGTLAFVIVASIPAYWGIMWGANAFVEYQVARDEAQEKEQKEQQQQENAKHDEARDKAFAIEYMQWKQKARDGAMLANSRGWQDVDAYVTRSGRWGHRLEVFYARKPRWPESLRVSVKYDSENEPHRLWIEAKAKGKDRFELNGQFPRVGGFYSSQEDQWTFSTYSDDVDCLSSDFIKEIDELMSFFRL